MKTNPNLTKFQIRVFKAAQKIPFAETRSYKWVAKRIGRPEAVRAVGQALKSNPYPFVIPCHRVIKLDGSLGGYSQGADIKNELLKFEQSVARQIR